MGNSKSTGYKFSSNNLSGIIPSFIGHLSGLYWLQLNNNSLYGELPLGLRNCTHLLVLDLGENGFFGNIPEWIGELESLRILRLHSNMFNDMIPSQLCQLLGTIPESMPNLSFMGHLNLSYNNLSGRIPTRNQLKTLDDPSICVGNSELCGAFIPKKCSIDRHS
ncbi:probable LRR receptor-like serine/threonine-protein kinase At3g47570 [Camellia sinensis]|uniref:probable LRR receptor-like serine/threonine-protein kinase At3g47570 n=1 Tax=Camellia sinensis TaxID=4442 RepID=UPI001036107F|nr:probable LRR receptor-like serine/threonine-protein kinase At3g47570 [Camellia sinensis]